MQDECSLRRMKRGPTVKGSVAALALDLGHEDFIDGIDIDCRGHVHEHPRQSVHTAHSTLCSIPLVCK